jgi:hypothetical protein
VVCPKCRLLAPINSGHFELEPNPFQPDRTRYVHKLCPKKPSVLPSRFMIACKAGHLEDFPWMHFVHGENSCKGDLTMFEMGVSGEPSDIYIKCRICNKSRPMSDAFSSDEEQLYKPLCRGRRPHLRDFEKRLCQFEARTMLLAASNTYPPAPTRSTSLWRRNGPCS